MENPVLIIVDLFGGGGGDATGFEQAIVDGFSIAKVIICVNHDETALKTHSFNYPHVKHFKEDVRTVDLTELKTLMIENGITNIFYRPLRIHEKKIIQGFPEDYKLFGNQAQQDKQIGNSVVPLVVKVWAEALANKIIYDSKSKVA